MAIGIVAFLLLGRWLFDLTPTYALRIFLEPSAILINSFYNTTYHWIPEQGIVFSSLGVMLDRSCSGAHFMLVLIASCTWWTRSMYRHLLAYFLVPAAILSIAWLLVITSNSMRVITTIMAGRFDPTGWMAETARFHEFLGIIIQISLLFLCHAAIRYAIRSGGGSRPT